MFLDGRFCSTLMGKRFQWQPKLSCPVWAQRPNPCTWHRPKMSQKLPSARAAGDCAASYTLWALLRVDPLRPLRLLVLLPRLLQLVCLPAPYAPLRGFFWRSLHGNLQRVLPFPCEYQCLGDERCGLTVQGGTEAPLSRACAERASARVAFAGTAVVMARKPAMVAHPAWEEPPASALTFAMAVTPALAPWPASGRVLRALPILRSQDFSTVWKF